MLLEAFRDLDSPIRRVDPRARVVVALLLSVTVVFCQQWWSLLAGLAVAGLVVWAARIPPRLLALRLLPLELLLLVLWVVLPFNVAGDSPYGGPHSGFNGGPHSGPYGEWVVLPFSGPVDSPSNGGEAWGWSWLGVEQALRITIKAHALALLLAGLVATLDPVQLGHALVRLRVPERFALLFFLTLRYLETMDRERRRLQVALRARGFRPRLSPHTARAYGYLIGMLLVLSLDRAERLAAGMKCRGFRGKVFFADPFVFDGKDWGVLTLAVFAAIGLCAGDWLSTPTWSD